jgi:trehalose synthase
MKSETSKLVEDEIKRKFPLEDGTVYSRRKGFQPFCAPPIEDYIPIVGEEKVEELRKLAAKLKGVKIVEVNSSAIGGGVAEMLYSQVPFVNQLGLEDEWKVISGTEPFYQVTKNIHNLLQGKRGTLTPEMIRRYYSVLKKC